MNLETSFSFKRNALFFALACALFAQPSALFAQGLRIDQKPARTSPSASDLFLIQDAAGNTWKLRMDQITIAGVGTGDASTNTISSVDGEIVLFSGTAGKTLKRGNSLNGILKFTSGVPSSANANVDFAKPVAATIGDASGTWNAGATVLEQSAALTANRTSNLPAANSFTPGTIIRFVDRFTTGNFGRGFIPVGSDTLDDQNNAAWTALGGERFFIAGGRIAGKAKTVWLATDGASAWREVFGNMRAVGVVSPNDDTKTLNFNIENPAFAGSGYQMFPTPAGDGATVPNTPVNPGYWFNGFNLATGQFSASQIHPSDLVPVQDVVDAAAITGNTHTVPQDGSVDSEKLTAVLSAPLTDIWPPASAYIPGESIRFYDQSGSISKSNTVTIVPSPGSGNTFNGASSYTINQQNGLGVFIADSSGNWAVAGFSTAGSGLPAFAGQLVENSSAHTLTWNTTPGQTLQTAYALPTANDILNITNATQGNLYELMVIQDSTGGRKITLPFGSETPSRTIVDAVENSSTTLTSATALFTANDVGKIVTGSGIPAATSIASVTNATTAVLSNAATATATGVTIVIKGSGIVNLSLGPNEITKIQLSYYNTASVTWLVDSKSDYTAAAASTCSIDADIYGPWSGTVGVRIGNGAAAKYVATGSFTPTSTNNVICGIKVPVVLLGTGAGDITVKVYANDGAGGTPGTLIATTNTVTASNFIQTSVTNAIANPVMFPFASPVTLSTSSTYFVSFNTSVAGTTTNCYQIAAITGGANPLTYKSSDGSAWVSNVTLGKLFFKTIK